MTTLLETYRVLQKKVAILNAHGELFTGTFADVDAAYNVLLRDAELLRAAAPAERVNDVLVRGNEM